LTAEISRQQVKCFTASRRMASSTTLTSMARNRRLREESLPRHRSGEYCARRLTTGADRGVCASVVGGRR
jgi:hypothetical protein